MCRAESDEETREKGPWNVMNYYTKKLVRSTDPLGNMLSSPETIAESPLWKGDKQIKLKLSAEVLAKELNTTPEDLLQKLLELEAALPRGREIICGLRPADAIRLACEGAESIVNKLLQLRSVFPDAMDVVSLIARWPEALLLDVEKLQTGLTALETAFGTEVSTGSISSSDDAIASVIVDVATSCPQILDPDTLKRVLKGAEGIMTRRQLVIFLQQDPDHWMQFVSLKPQERGHRESEYASSDGLVHRRGNAIDV